MKDQRVIYGSRNGEEIHEYFDNLKNIISEIPKDKTLDDLTVFLIFKLFGYNLDQFQEDINLYSFSNKHYPSIKINRKKEYKLSVIIPTIHDVIVEISERNHRIEIKEAVEYVFSGYPKNKKGLLDIQKLKSNKLLEIIKSK